MSLRAAILALCLTACATPPPDNALYTLWTLSEIDGVPVSAHAPTIPFSAAGAFGGGVSCNAYSGNYERRGNRLVFSQFEMTALGCQMPLDQQEVHGAFVDALNGSLDAHLASRDTLVLSGRGHRLRFRRTT